MVLEVQQHGPPWKVVWVAEFWVAGGDLEVVGLWVGKMGVLQGGFCPLFPLMKDGSCPSISAVVRRDGNLWVQTERLLGPGITRQKMAGVEIFLHHT